MESVGVGFKTLHPVRAGNQIFISVILRKTGHPALPKPLFGELCHGVPLPLAPVVEIPNDTNALRMGSPGDKLGGILRHMGAQQLLRLVVGALMEQVGGELSVVFFPNHIALPSIEPNSPPFLPSLETILAGLRFLFLYSTIIFRRFQAFLV